MSFYGVKLHRSDSLRLPEHPEACTEDTFVEWCRARARSGQPLAVDLFSGAGGLSLGLEQAGWAVVASVDNDPRALETHRANFPGLALDADLGDPDERSRIISLLRQANIDLVAGGPPCQPFSRAGRSKIRSLVEAGCRDPNDPRRELWQAFLDVALGVRPRAVLMENVPDMALGDDFRVVRIIVDRLERAGYQTQVSLVDASKYGVPQHRKRLIVLARLDSTEFPWRDECGEDVTVYDAIWDLPRLPDAPEVGGRELPYSPPSQLPDFALRMRKDADEVVIWDHMTRPVRRDDLQIFQEMDHKTLYSEIDPELRRYNPDIFDDRYKRLHWGSPSRSITAHIAKDGYWYIHPEQHRTLTVREAARIQTFPDRYRFAGTRSDAFRQIGNAVPPDLGEAAASALKPKGDKSARSAVTPSQWLAARQHLLEWARLQSNGEHWFAFPSQDVTPAVAAVVVLVSAGRNEPRGLGRALEPLRGSTTLTDDDVDRVIDSLGNSRTARHLDRLRTGTTKRNIWGDSPEQAVELAKELGLRPAEKALFFLLRGRNLMLTSQGPLRVAAKVANSTSDRVNRLTDGRIDLARLVGSGETEAPLRMAALRLIGKTICLPKEQFCSACPLRPWCKIAKGRPDALTLY